MQGEILSVRFFFFPFGETAFENCIQAVIRIPHFENELSADFPSSYTHARPIYFLHTPLLSMPSSLYLIQRQIPFLSF